MKTVKDVSELTGVSVRALHHYDAIGLLHPTRVTEAGYRLYDGEALKRLWAILLFRELDFPLAEIRAILDNPALDRAEVLNAQIELLEMRRNRLDGVIRLAKNVRDKGGMAMSFEAFDKEKTNEYARRAREAWGDTEAYREFERRDAVRAGGKGRGERGLDANPPGFRRPARARPGGRARAGAGKGLEGLHYEAFLRL